MTARRLGILALALVLGLAIGALTAYAVQPRSADAGLATPVPAESPSVPVDEPTQKPHGPEPAPDITYPTLPSDLRLNVVHRIKNDLATWEYHVPEGWTAYAVCTAAPCKFPTDSVLPPKKVDKQDQVRFRPADEPTTGGYSLRVRVLDNTLALDAGQLMATKIKGFQDAYPDQFRILRQTSSAVYFTYRDETNHQRLNYFQWFAAPGSSVATLEMSVSGRVSDKDGLQALFDRFADNLIATG